MHAEDICLMAPSPTFLRELIDNAMILVFKMIYLSTHPNRIVWCLSRKSYKRSCPIYIRIIYS